MNKNIFRVLMGMGLLLGPALTAAPAAETSHRQYFKKHHTAVIAAAPLVGEVESTRKFHIAVSLPLRNQVELDQLLKDLYDPKSPSYHHFLQPEDFASRFGPAEQDAQAVSDYFTSRGMTVTKVHSNRVVVDVEGNNDAIQKAFHVRLHNYRRPDGSTFFGPDDVPSVDIDTPIANISGIENYVLPRYVAPKPLTTPPHKTGLAAGGWLAPIDLRNSYAGNVSLKGDGQSVALFELSTYDTSDVAPWQAAAVTIDAQSAAMYSTFGAVNNIYLDGWNSTTAPNADVEVGLDIDCVASMAPKATIDIYMGSDSDDVLNQIATDNTCKQISASWEYGTTGSAFSEFAAQGQTYLNASGDWFSYDSTNNSYDPNSYSGYSLNYYYVTIVGGTELNTVGDPSTYSSEVAWNQGNAATGGGILTLVSIPSFQQGINMSTNGGSTTNRNAPDISADAYGVWMYSSGSWFAEGGTSAATPMWAGYMALVNQQAGISGVPSVGFPDPIIYSIASNPTKYAADFRDITSGNNTGFNAVTGYDLVTGWGSPNGQNLINDLLGLASGPTATFTSTFTVNLTHTATPTFTATFTKTSTPTATATLGSGGNCSGLPTWTSTGMPLYQAGTLVVYQGNEYKALVTTYGLDAYTPGSTPTVWQLIGPCGANATNTFTSTSTSTATNSSTGTPTNTATKTATATLTASPTITKTPTATLTPTLTYTPTASSTATSTNTGVATSTNTNTFTSTFTPTATATRTNTGTPTNTLSPTSTSTFTKTNTPVPPTSTFTKTATPTFTPTQGQGGNCAGLPTWTSAGMPLYQAGTLVVYQGNEYKALVTTYGLDVYAPGITPTVWQLIGPCGASVPLALNSSSAAVIPAVVAVNNSDQRQYFKNHRSPAMVAAPLVGEVESGHKFHIAISLPLRNTTGLTQLIKNLYDPQSPSYHHFLRPEEFTAQYGPSAEDAQAVANYMSANGLTVTKIHSNRVIVDVEGDNDAIQKAFHVRLHHYQRPNGTTFFGPDGEPSVDLNNPIEAVSGLDNFIQPKHRTSAQSLKPIHTGLGFDGFNAPIDLRNAYASNVSLKGSGQTVALVESSNYSAADLANYQAQAATFGSPDTQSAAMYSSFGTVSNVYLNGINSGTTYSADDNSTVLIDIECVESVAPGASIMVYIGGIVDGSDGNPDYTTSSDDILNQIATDDICKQISYSALYTSTGTPYAEFAAQGQTSLNSSGDWSYYGSPSNNVDCNDTNPNDYAGSDLNFNYVTIVGGTELTMTGNVPVYSGEVAWNQGSTGETTCTGGSITNASGGGILTFLPIPAYQQGMNMSTNGGSTTYRNAPDVSADAYGIAIWANGGWEGQGGTSTATPLWAGYMALVDQQAAISGVPSIGWANPAIYAIGNNPTKYAADFHDVTSGNNGNFNAVTGYDLVTGWGSPNGEALINDLVGISGATATFTPTAVVSATRTNTPTFTATSTATRTFTATATLTPTYTPTFTQTSGTGGNCAGLPTWTSTGMPLYQAGTLVVYQGNEYKALVTTYGLDAYTPGSTPTVWQLIGTCGMNPTNTFTSTSTSTATNSFTATPTNTATKTVTATLTASPTFTATSTNTSLVTETATFSATSTATKVNTATSTFTLTPTATSSNTWTPTATNTATRTNSPTATWTFTSTNTAKLTATFTFTFTPTNTLSPTSTSTATKTNTPVPPTATFTKTSTPVNTSTSTATSTAGSGCSGVAAWNGNFVAYALGAKVTYNGELYQCISAHTSEPNWMPPVVPSLWKDLGACSGAIISTNTASVLQSAVAGPNISKGFEPVHFFIQLKKTAQVTVNIFTPMGQLVAHTSFFGNSGMNDWLWDVQNAAHSMVSSGLYVYSIQATSEGSTESKMGKIVIVH